MLKDESLGCRSKREKFQIQIRKQHREEIYSRKRQPFDPEKQEVHKEQLSQVFNEEQCLNWLQQFKEDYLSPELLQHLDNMLKGTKNLVLVKEIFNLYIRCTDINCLTQNLVNWSTHREFIIPSLTLLKALLCYSVSDLFDTPFMNMLDQLYEARMESGYVLQEWFHIVEELAIKCIPSQVGQKQMLFLLKISQDSIIDITILYYLSRAAIPNNKEAADYIIESGLLEVLITNIYTVPTFFADLLDILKVCLSYSEKAHDICIKCDIFAIYYFFFTQQYIQSETSYYIRLDILDQITTFAFTKYYRQVVESDIFPVIMQSSDYQQQQLTILSELIFTLAVKDSEIETKPQVMNLLKQIISTKELPRQIIEEAFQSYDLILNKAPPKLKQILKTHSYQIGLYQMIEHLRLK